GRVGAVYQQGYDTAYPQPGYSEQDPESIVQAVKAGIRQVVAEMGHMPAGIAFSSAMHSILALDAWHRPLCPLIIWADNRSQDIADALRGTAQGRMLYEQTAVPMHPMLPLCKIAWLRREQPAVFEQAARFAGIKEYILHQLSGQY